MTAPVSSQSNVIVYDRPWNKPFPNVDYDIEPFWNGLKEHRFLLFRCQTCGAWYFPATFCRKHDNDYRMANLAWEEASGRGTIFAMATVYYAFDASFEDDVPYINALIELDEGPMISSNIVGCDVETVQVGMLVDLVFEDHPIEGFTMPKFRLRSE